MNDQLKKIALERDVNAFRQLFLTFGPKVRAMMLRQGADRDMAEEIVQETMLTVWRKSHLFAENKGSIASWIFTIARNLRVDRVRRQIVWQGSGENLDTMPSEEEPADVRIAREQEREQITTAVARLPPEQLQIIKLCFEDGLTQLQIANKLNIPLGTVKSRMRLAYDRLRGSMERAS
jgi:RNA polymerase sigma-70 factor (ECF subfamily)